MKYTITDGSTTVHFTRDNKRTFFSQLEEMLYVYWEAIPVEIHWKLLWGAVNCFHADYGTVRYKVTREENNTILLKELNIP